MVRFLVHHAKTSHIYQARLDILDMLDPEYFNPTATLCLSAIFKTIALNYRSDNSFPFQSGVTSVTFAKFHPNLIVGGTYSGQIVLWDNRSSKKTPVQRTPLSATAHTVSEFYVNFVFLLWCLDVRAK